MIDDYSAVTAGRAARLCALDEALALEQYRLARELALAEWASGEELLLWIEREIERIR